ncbi:MAG: arginine--tRNA ligase [Alphaproteobacteria bacterium]
MSVREELGVAVSRAFQTLGLDPALAVVRRSDRPDLADYQTSGALGAAKAQKRNPRELAEALKTALTPALPGVEISVAGPGFLNFRLGAAYVTKALDAMARAPKHGLAQAPTQRITIDYGGPNIAKPMHVGHLRSSLIGEAIKRILRAVGHEVTSDIHLGDWGRQMGMIIFGVRERSPQLPYFDESYKGPYPEQSPVTLADLEAIYPDISARSENDATVLDEVRRITYELQQGRPGYRALWAHIDRISIDEIKQDLSRLGVSFDQWFGESRYQDRLAGLIAELESKGIARESEGAIIIPVARNDDKKEMPPVILRSSEGAALYHTTDLATIEERIKTFRAQAILYVVDNRQALHFEQLFRAAQLAEFGKGVDLEHLGFGTMNGPDGKPFKTRAGGTVKLKDLIDTLIGEARTRLSESERLSDLTVAETERVAELVGIATLKFADLQHDRKSNYIFDLQKFSRFEGKTGPYLLYSAVRIKSILAKAKEQGLAPGALALGSGAEERALAAILLRWSDEVWAAYEARAPHILADYVFELAQVFSQFYHANHILSESDAARRGAHLALAELTLRVLESGLDLLGIETPERM